MNDNGVGIITYSSAKSFCLCEQKYKWRFEDGLVLRDDEDSEPLIIGTAFHAGAEAYLLHGLEAGLAAITDWRASRNALGDAIRKLDEQAAKAKAMLRASALKWPLAGEQSQTERTLRCPIINPETGARSKSFVLMGKVDGIIGKTLCDWKGVANPDDFVRSQKIGYQVECYVIGLKEDGIECDSAEFRLVTRPGIKFCSKDADIEAYENRCLQWLTEDGTALVHHEQFVTDARLGAAREWLWSVSKRILDCRRTGAWLTNELACKTYGRECEYVPLCVTKAMGGDVTDIIAARYEIGEKHPELG